MAASKREAGSKQPWQIVNARFLASAAELDQLPPPLHLEVAFAGRSNVGKSSLMNALMARRKLVRTSSTPGCTRAVSFFEAEARDGARLYLVDLPGYGYARRGQAERRRWAELVEGFLGARDQLRAIVLLVDARRGLEPGDEALVDFTRARPAESRPAVVVVATKIDRVARSKRRAALHRLGAREGRVIGVSARTGEGMAALWIAIRGAVGLASPGG